MNFKKLREKRAALQKELAAILAKAEKEERALDESEVKEFEAKEQEIKNIDSTLALEKRAVSSFTEDEEEQDEEEQRAKDVEKAEERAFANYIRGVVEERADVTMSMSANGAVIPSTIAKRIISRLEDICPIYRDAERFNVKGNLSLPYYDETTQQITMKYATEGKAVESTSGQFKSIELKGFLGSAVCDISKSLINNSDFDITSFVVGKMAEAISKFLEKEILIGTANKIEGISTASQIVTAANTDKVTSDEIIDLQEEIPDEYQEGAYFIMSRSTRKAIRKLKDGQGNYLLNKDATSRWGYTLFGKDVYTSASMPNMAAGTKAIIYLNPKGVAVKVSEEISIDILREIKAPLHLVEALGFVETDSKIQNEQMVAVLQMKAS